MVVSIDLQILLRLRPYPMREHRLCSAHLHGISAVLVSGCFMSNLPVEVWYVVL